MANVYAVKSGNWSDTTVWNTGALPTSADDVYANTFTVTVNISATVLTIRNTSITGVTIGGGFSLSGNGVTLQCTSGAIMGSAFDIVLNVNPASGSTCSYIGNITTWTGNNSSTGVQTINSVGSGVFNWTGTISWSGANNYNFAVVHSGAGIMNITTTTITNSTIGGVLGAIRNTSSGTLIITGTLSAEYSTGVVVNNESNGAVTIIGTASGGGRNAVINSSNGTLTINGTINAGGQSPAIGPGSPSQITVLTGPFLTSLTGINPVTALRWFWDNSSVTPTYYQIRTANLATIRPLYTADSVGGNPSVSNVRSGTVFGPSSELTGTAVIPSVYSVSTGVPVDNTVGSGPIDPTQFWNHPISGITTSGSIGERLKTAATVNVMGQLISDSFSAR